MSIKQIFDKAATEIINEIRANMVAGNVNATRKTSNSLEQKTSEEKMQVLGSKSFLFVEVGRAPGKNPPFKPIREWVEARGLGSGTNANGIAWAVVKAIGRRGTLARRTDKIIEPRDVFQSVVTRDRVQHITDQINKFKIAQATSEIVEAFRGKGITVT